MKEPSIIERILTNPDKSILEVLTDEEFDEWADSECLYD